MPSNKKINFAKRFRLCQKNLILKVSRTKPLNGKPLLGKDGAFAPLLGSILNAALEGEMDVHLTDNERQIGNRRNRKMPKQVQTGLGEVTISTSRDRNSSFDSQFIKKREIVLAEGVSDQIIVLYVMGNSTRQVSD